MLWRWQFQIVMQNGKVSFVGNITNGQCVQQSSNNTNKYPPSHRQPHLHQQLSSPTTPSTQRNMGRIAETALLPPSDHWGRAMVKALRVARQGHVKHAQSGGCRNVSDSSGTDAKQRRRSIHRGSLVTRAAFLLVMVCCPLPVECPLLARHRAVHESSK